MIGAVVRNEFATGGGLSRAILIALILGTSAAMAFDTTKLGQQGTLSSEDFANHIVPLVDESRRLQKEFKQAFAEKDHVRTPSCIGMRFPGQWEHLAGERVAPYWCDFGPKSLEIRATVQITDRNGRVFEKITPKAMRNATRVIETNPRWKWEVE